MTLFARPVETLVAIQARMSSTRLPGKTLLKVLDKPLLAYQLERTQRAQLVDHIVVATTDSPADQPIVDLCTNLGIDVFRGSEHDVLSRLHGAAQAYAARYVVRCTADCPLIDWGLMDEVIATVTQSDGRVDYAANALERTYPIGLDCEAMTFEALDSAHREARDPRHREHVTPYLYSNPERFGVVSLKAPALTPMFRWTVDTPEDFALVERIIGELYPRNPAFRWTDALALMQQHPELAAINEHVPHRRWDTQQVSTRRPSGP